MEPPVASIEVLIFHQGDPVRPAQDLEGSIATSILEDALVCSVGLVEGLAQTEVLSVAPTTS